MIIWALIMVFPIYILLNFFSQNVAKLNFSPHNVDKTHLVWNWDFQCLCICWTKEVSCLLIYVFRCARQFLREAQWCVPELTLSTDCLSTPFKVGAAVHLCAWVWFTVLNPPPPNLCCLLADTKITSLLSICLSVCPSICHILLCEAADIHVLCNSLFLFQVKSVSF